MKSNIMKIPAAVGTRSLIGVGKQRPCSWGNYFWFDGINYRDKGWRVLNMWAENLQDAKEKFLEDGMVQIRTYEYEDKKFCIIDDDRIPEDYYYNKLCFTGYYRPSAEVAKEIFDYLGDPDNEYEQYVDPVKYWDDRGWVYNPETGIRTIRAYIEERKNE